MRTETKVKLLRLKIHEYMQDLHASCLKEMNKDNLKSETS